MHTQKDLLAAEAILSAQPHLVSYITLQTHHTIDSTNLQARRAAADGAGEGLVVISGSQSAGRGRLGRSFFSPDDTGLYMSILLRPTLPPEKAVLITSAVAVAVCDAIREVCGMEAGIKWVNDIFLHDRKVCGILTEAAFSPSDGHLEYSICGIGINVYPPENGFPEEIAAIAGAVCPAPSSGLRNRLAAAVLHHFFHYYHTLEQKEFIPEYRRRSVVIGRRVHILRGEQCVPATALDIDDDCRLLVSLEDGTQQALSTGEISIRLKSD